jgi:hypothetical protein
VTRAEALAKAVRHLDYASGLLWNGDGADAVPRAAAHAATGRGYVALAADLASVEAAEAELLRQPDVALCGHRRGVVDADPGARSVWLHALDLSRCDSPPSG